MIEIFNFKGDFIKKITGEGGIINTAILSKDNKYIISIGTEGLKKRNFENGEIIKIFYPNRLKVMCLSNDENFIAYYSQDNKYIEVKDFTDGKFITKLILQNEDISGLAISKNNDYVLSLSKYKNFNLNNGDNNIIKIWNIKTGKIIKILKEPRQAYREDYFFIQTDNNLFLSKDNNFIVSRDSDLNFITIWNFQTGEIINKFKVGSVCRGLFMSNDNDYILYGTDKEIQIWK